MTEIFEGTEVTPWVFFVYLTASFVVLQAWMYMTNYVNRFGCTRLGDKVGLVVNMCAMVYLSDTLGVYGEGETVGFNVSMLVILATVGVLYALRMRDGRSARDMAVFSLRTLVPICAIYLFVAIALDAFLTFAAIIALFSCYVVQAHYLVEHHQVRRGLRLIYCHFFIVIAVNLFTVSLNLLLEESAEATILTCMIAAVSIAIFFCCLFLLSDYHRAGVAFTRRERTALAAFVVAGCALTFAGLSAGIVAFLCGPLLAAVGCFAVLDRKRRALAEG